MSDLSVLSAAGESKAPPFLRQDEGVSVSDLVECRRLLSALVAAVEGGELDTAALQLSALRGALVMVESLLTVQNTGI